jgi:hypothetical protein
MRHSPHLSPTQHGRHLSWLGPTVSVYEGCVDRPVLHIFGLGQTVSASQRGERSGGELLEDFVGGAGVDDHDPVWGA